jgi:SAM-dependent methyltransferase
MGPPLRPCPDDIRHFSELLRLEPDRPLHALILGVTPELFHLDWPAGTVVRAADRSQKMIEAVWPGPPDAAMEANWLDMPYDDSTFDRVVCDGGLHLLGYPEEHRLFIDSIARVLKSNGRFVIRLFALPIQQETTHTIADDVWARRIPSFHVFKLRLAMALQRSSREGIPLELVFRQFVNMVGDPARLVLMSGWPVEEVSTISSYENSRDVYHFLTEEASIDALTLSGVFELESRAVSSYTLGERCPILSFVKREAHGARD